MYPLPADAVIVAHLLFIAFVVGGGLLVLCRPSVFWVHFPAALWGVFIEMTGWVCLLTPLENYLRRLGGESAYSGGFIEQYILPVIYPSNLTAATQYVLGGLVIVINLMIYAYVIRKRRGHYYSATVGR